MDLRVRFAEIALDERKMAPQTRAVQSDASIRKLQLTPTGLAMMSAIVGKRIPRILKDQIGHALQDTLTGQFDDGEVTEGDIYAQVYGEVLGPLFTCLERGGDFEVIRLIVPRKQRDRKSADFLLVDRARGLVMLQECKGHCPDYDSVTDDPGSLDVCGAARRLRSKGKKQLVWPDPSQVSGRRVRIAGIDSYLALPFPHAEQAVAVTAVPDGRLRSAGFRVEPPEHDGCATPCTTCLFGPDPTIVSVLFSQAISPVSRVQTNGPDGPAQLGFLDWYKACERAIWGQSHGSFSNTYGSLLDAWGQLERASETEAGQTSFLLALAEDAVHRNVFVDFGSVFHACEASQVPHGLFAGLQRLHSVQGEVERPPVHEGSTEQLGAMLFGGEGERDQWQRAVGNWLLRTHGEASEMRVAPPTTGVLQATLVPRGRSEDASMNNLCWGISEVLSAGRFPPEFIYESFVDEVVVWRRPDSDEVRQFRLGKCLWGPPWPWWHWGLDRRTLDEMHHCCPYCDEIAHYVERGWRDGFHPFHHNRYWRRHRRDRYGEGLSGPAGAALGPTAFVTTDARAVVTVPLAP